MGAQVKNTAPAEPQLQPPLWGWHPKLFPRPDSCWANIPTPILLLCMELRFSPSVVVLHGLHLHRRAPSVADPSLVASLHHQVPGTQVEWQLRVLPSHLPTMVARAPSPSRPRPWSQWRACSPSSRVPMQLWCPTLTLCGCRHKRRHRPLRPFPATRGAASRSHAACRFFPTSQRSIRDGKSNLTSCPILL
jgi:hypothetical protein